MQHLEFTIEPFVEGTPGPHVTAAVTAVEALGVEVEFGPFGSSCRCADDQVAHVVAAVTAAAVSNHATHIHLELTREPEPGPSDPAPPGAIG